MATRHWLTKAHEAMTYAGLGHLWQPGSTTWRHFTPEWATETAEYQALQRAQRDGYLTRDTGIPQLTQLGYHRY